MYEQGDEEIIPSAGLNFSTRQEALRDLAHALRRAHSWAVLVLLEFDENLLDPRIKEIEAKLGTFQEQMLDVLAELAVIHRPAVFSPGACQTRCKSDLGICVDV